MISIRKSLTRRLSVAISIMVVGALLVTDLAVDGWVEDQFDEVVRNKIGLLETLVNEDVDGVEFEFAGEYLPEFEGSDDPEYFQLWHAGDTFEKSNTLFMHATRELPFRTTPLNQIQTDEIQLPDGRAGRIAWITFIPQIDTDDRQAFSQTYGDAARQPMTIAYAVSIEDLEYSLWLIDISFIAALILVPLLVRFTVRNTVAFALEPLDELNLQIRKLTLSNDQDNLNLSNPVEELEPVIDSLNHFINENSLLYQQQKRLTSDIAHELKTPVTELITLSEIMIRFPGDEELEKSYKPDVLAIAERMKSIISSLLTIHKYSSEKLNCDEKLNILTVIERSVASVNSERIRLLTDENLDHVLFSNEFALQSVFTNLLSNALQHSKADTMVLCSIESNDQDTIQVVVSNTPALPLGDTDLNRMFDPLWQLDPARTSTENFGLGLSIVKVLLDAIQGEISVRVVDEQVTFRVLLPHNRRIGRVE